MTSAHLAIRVVGGALELRCACGLQLTQALRDLIAERCPKCRGDWTREATVESTRSTAPGGNGRPDPPTECRGDHVSPQGQPLMPAPGKPRRT